MAKTLSQSLTTSTAKQRPQSISELAIDSVYDVVAACALIGVISILQHTQKLPANGIQLTQSENSG